MNNLKILYRNECNIRKIKKIKREKLVWDVEIREAEKEEEQEIL
jgi:hypothetical protein